MVKPDAPGEIKVLNSNVEKNWNDRLCSVWNDFEQNVCACENLWHYKQLSFNLKSIFDMAHRRHRGGDFIDFTNMTQILVLRVLVLVEGQWRLNFDFIIPSETELSNSQVERNHMVETLQFQDNI